MSLPTRKFAVASTAWSNGIRVYYNRPGIGIHEACLDQDANSVGFSPDSDDGWYNGSTLSATCASWSALCCISWTDPGSATRKLSLFYQTEDKVIHETRFDGLNWTVSSFTQPDAMSGTAMAAIYNENANRVLFFFQDNDGYISCRRAIDWNWEAAVRICIARSGTPIAATSFGDTKEIYLFSQQADLRVQEHCSSFTQISNWQLLLKQVTSETFGSMAAVSWQEEEVRVYMQTADNNSMWELSLYSGGSFDFRRFADVIPPPDTDISAFVRNSSKGYFIHLYSATSEKKLQQRVLAPAGWRAETFVADVPLPDLNLTQIPSTLPAFSGSFPNSRKIATAATVWSNGSGSIYYSGNGHIREASRNLSSQDSWRRGALDGTCAPGTSLCCVSWGDSNVSLFYQTADAIIHEMRYNGQNWSVSTFTQAGAMPGTALAAVQNQNADRVVIFYQDSDNFVCSRRAINWVWDPPVQICTARSAAAFSATTWSNTQDIRLFLDNDHAIEEYSGSFDGNWVKEQYGLASDDPIIGMTAISWLGPKFKLYVRKDNSIMEVSYTQGAYSRNTSTSTLDTAMLANVDVSAFWRTLPSGGSIHVLYGNFTKIEQQVLEGQKNQWQVETPTLDITDLVPRALSVPNLTGTDLADNSVPSSKLESPAPPQCPVAIAATGWTGSVRVYTQSGDGFIREGSYDPHVIPWNPDQALRIDQVFSQTDLARRMVDGWRRATLPKACAPWSSLCCLSWGVDSTRNVSVFYQNRDNTLHEMRYDGRDWSTTGFVQADAMPGTAMAEVHNENVNGQLFFFQDSYRFLSYRVAINSVWEPAVRICQAATATPIAATTWSNCADVRLYFQDKTNQIREFSITFRNNDLYDGNWALGALKISGCLTSSMAVISWPGPQIRLYMQQADNSLREWRCGRYFVYTLQPFALDQESNRAARNTAIAAFCSTRVDFGNLYWAASDKALRQRILSDTQWLTADSIGDLSICGPLGAALAGPFTLAQLVDQTKCLSDNITEIRAQVTALSQFGQELSDSLIPQLRPFADTAVDGILALAHSVEELSSCVGNTDDLVKTCKTQAETVDKRFKLLYNQARVSLVSAVNLATDVTYQQSTIELRGARITELLALSADMRAGEEKVAQLRQGEIDAAQKHLDMLEKAKKDAQENRDEAEKLRIVRDVFTLGLGEAGDWGSLNDAMNHMDTLIGYINSEMSTSQKAKEEAQAAVTALNTELARYTQLKTDLDGFAQPLDSQRKAMTNLAGRIGELRNKTFDIGNLISPLLAKSSALPVQHTARQLAESVVQICDEIKTTNKLTGVFVTNPDSMETTLQAIAASPVEASEEDDLI